MTTQQERLLQVKAVALIVSLGVSTIWRKAKEGTFPSPIRVDKQITRWKLSEVNEWLADPMNWEAK